MTIQRTLLAVAAGSSLAWSAASPATEIQWWQASAGRSGDTLAASVIAGTPPTYTDRALSVPPNMGAIRARMWVPEIDLAFVPQGLTVAGDVILLAAYNSEGGPPKCRLYRIDRKRLVVTGTFDMPSLCAHAGGLANAGNDRLFVADTWRLYEIDLARAFEPASAGNAVLRNLSLKFPLRGSFIAYRQGSLWIGEYKKPQPGRIYEVPLSVLEAASEPPGLSVDDARRSLDISAKAQGASFDREGYLWISTSNSQSGGLEKLDGKTGAVLATYPAVAGIEDLGFDSDGLLWAVAEAGARRWQNWPTYYPILFAIDVKALH